MASDSKKDGYSNADSPYTNGSADKLKSPGVAYETFNTPPTRSNVLPEGSGENTAGAIGRQDIPSLVDAIKTVRWQDFMQVHMYPCTKDSLLSGIGGAFGMGGIKAVFGAPIPKAANWAVGTFIIVAVAQYEYCQAKRSIEKTQVKKIVEIMDQKKAEKEALKAKLENENKPKNRDDASTHWWNWKF